jgi:hypothetical protein
VRERLRTLAQTRWLGGTPSTAARRLVMQLQALIRPAARHRDAAELARLERALRFTAGGHTAGEAALVEQLANAPSAELRSKLGALPSPTPSAEPAEMRLAGMVLFLD